MESEYHVVLLSQALRDLDDIYGYIAGTLLEPNTAMQLIDNIEYEILSLREMPHRCPTRRQGIYSGKYRQLFIKNYTVVFRIDEDKKQVVVVTVRYAKSQF